MKGGCSRDGVSHGKKRVLGDATNILGKRPSLSDMEKPVGGHKAGRYDGPAFSDPKNVNCEKQVHAMRDGAVKSKGKARYVPGIFEDIFEDDESISSFGMRPIQSLASDGGVSFGLENADSPWNPSDTMVQHTAGESDARPASKGSGLRYTHKSLDALTRIGDRAGESSTDSEVHSEERDEAESEERDEAESEERDENLDLSIRVPDKVRASHGDHLTKDQTANPIIHNPSGCLGFDIRNTTFSSMLDNAPNKEIIMESGIKSEKKSCTCSFCLKAAYMLMDLQYQDTRGRLAALKKSRKLTRSLEGKMYGLEYTVKGARDNSKQAVDMEVELEQQWKSLFHHTENILARDATQLHSTLSRLKEYREDCKRELQKISKAPSDE